MPDVPRPMSGDNVRRLAVAPHCEQAGRTGQPG